MWHRTKSTWSETIMHLFPWSCVKKKSVLPTGRKWNEVVRKWMLIFVFLSLVSCHLGSLTIVSVLHILLLQLALSVQREKRDVWTEEQGGKIVEHTRQSASLGCHRRAEKGQRQKRSKGRVDKKVVNTYPVKGHCVLFPYNCFLHRCTLQHKTWDTYFIGPHYI